MKKHSIPQNIMDFEFKLFGNLTIRQFSTIAVACVISLAIYFLGLPDILVYPIIFFIIFIALGASFMTVNGMPFSKWLLNYISSLLKSQRMVYRSSNQSDNKKIIDTFDSNSVKLDDFQIDEYFSKKAEQKNLNTNFVEQSEITENFNNKYTVLDTFDQRDIPIELMPQTSSIQVVNTVETQFDNIDEPNTEVIPFILKTKIASPIVLDKKSKPVKKDVYKQINGLVTDKNNIPVTQANVYIKDSLGNLLRTTSTEQTGNFTFSKPLEKGNYILEISKSGHSFADFQIVIAEENYPYLKYMAN